MITQTAKNRHQPDACPASCSAGAGRRRQGCRRSLSGCQPQPEEDLPRRERNVQNTIEDAIDEGPRKCRHDQAEEPLFSGAKFKLDKRAERNTDGKAKQPDRSKIAEDPPEDNHGATIDDIDRYLRPCLLCMITAAPIPFPPQVHDQLTDGECQHGEPNHPRKEACPEIESQALRHGKDKYNHNKETK
jgi:hypothetical protein